ncbi:hypothetical protein AGMMS49949_02610 [Alphaproteobacteria bacterium]|nr:hypothetical protein AGMMS49949_02610 [Alphaproteobacteria bacterium]GHS95868.1 hypothetical protein AGMMS50296_1240 [Alphaproteobacteria bacterium]
MFLCVHEHTLKYIFDSELSENDVWAIALQAKEKFEKNGSAIKKFSKRAGGLSEQDEAQILSVLKFGRSMGVPCGASFLAQLNGLHSFLEDAEKRVKQEAQPASIAHTLQGLSLLHDGVDLYKLWLTNFFMPVRPLAKQPLLRDSRCLRSTKKA